MAFFLSPFLLISLKFSNHGFFSHFIIILPSKLDLLNER